MKFIVLLGLLLVSFHSPASSQDSSQDSSRNSSQSWQDWKTVGQGRLTWGFWTIYDSELRTPAGDFVSGQKPLALVITYRRDIDRDDLLEATDDQWQHLGIPASRRTLWLEQLSSIWPDVRKGDQLVFVFSDRGGQFFQADQVLGATIEQEFAQAFIDIWLSPDTAYPKLRRRLMGQQ
ncbi:chalcone isomerase family protein [Endozoicomonas montiporae]|uniref:Chalcone isomerase domain-containing protein n=1 Tax=Endozoicomonas montiporae CL-33 TaxID=570277 RepID=A0A142BH58_9GAMM|nr:chalcone isomerase family protein [Endozoicomonas montiporae]AMO58084.1 hypothetical protein EZMO1_4159 [Endozoicomonas montiporae CL-33]